MWQDLREAARLDVPGKSQDEIRARVLTCLGDPIGLPPLDPSAVPRPPTLPVLPEFRDLVRPVAARQKPVWAVSSGGEFLARGTATGLSLVGKDGGTLAEASSPLGAVYDLAFTPSSQLLLAGCEEGVAVWSVPSLTLRSFVRAGNVTSVAAHPHGRLFALAGRKVELWSLATNRPVAAFTTTRDAKVEFTADGRFLLAVRSGKPVAAWPVSNTPEKRSLTGHGSGVPGVVFSPDGTVLASASKDRAVKVWDAGSGALLFTGTGHRAAIEAMEFSPDGRLLASGDFRGEVRVWDWRAGREVARANGPGQVWRLRFGPAGQFLAAGGDSGVTGWAVRLTAKVVALEPFLKLEVAGVIDLAVHPSGAGLAFLDRSGRVSAYDLGQAAPPRRLAPQSSAREEETRKRRIKKGAFTISVPSK